MYIEYAKLLIPVLLPLFIKHCLELMQNKPKRHSKLVEDYSFIASFLANGDIEKRNRLVVEQAFYVFFRTRFSYESIKLLMSFPSPLRAFTLLMRGHKYLEVKRDKVDFNNSYKSEFKWKCIKRIKLAASYILIVLSIFTVVYAPNLLAMLGSTVYAQVLIGGAIFFLIGVTEMHDFLAMQASELLLQEQERLEGYKS